MVAAAVIGGGVLGLAGASMSSSASKDAAQTQANSSAAAQAQQQAQFNQTQANLKPYMNLGQSFINPLTTALGYNSDGSVNSQNMLQQRFSAPSTADAASAPGYDFTLSQGLKATQNSMAARGLGTSGAALKGAAGYATGLADSTYNDVYNRALQTFNTNYSSAANNANRLSNIVSSGQGAAAGLGGLGAQNSNAQSNLITGAGNAIASGMVGSANAYSSALSGAGNNAMIYGMLQNNSAIGSSVSMGAIRNANNSADPIASLNASQGWTGTQ